MAMCNPENWQHRMYFIISFPCCKESVQCKLSLHARTGIYIKENKVKQQHAPAIKKHESWITVITTVVEYTNTDIIAHILECEFKARKLRNQLNKMEFRHE